VLKKYGGAGIPLVETRAKFLAPCRYGDIVEITSTVARLGRSSFDVEHRLMNGGALAVEGFETRVWTGRHPDDPTRIKAQPIPPEIVERFRSAG
jgi:4-hydroxybenzoyl-CoA thioesterase